MSAATDSGAISEGFSPMSYTTSASASVELASIVQRVRNNLQAINEAHTNVWGHVFAIGDNLIVAHDSLVPKRRWGRFLREEFGIGRTKAFDYCRLAEHRKELEPFVRRAEQTGKPLTIRAALRLIGPEQPPKPRRPKTLSEVERPPALGDFLEQHHDLFFVALAYAPQLKALIEHRLLRPLAQHEAVHPPKQLILDESAYETAGMMPGYVPPTRH
jgi:hypothetical protein